MTSVRTVPIVDQNIVPEQNAAVHLSGGHLVEQSSETQSASEGNSTNFKSASNKGDQGYFVSANEENQPKLNCKLLFVEKIFKEVLENFYDNSNLTFFYTRELFNDNIKDAVERNKIERLLLTFQSQLKSKLLSSEVIECSDFSFEYVVSDFQTVAKEFLKLSKSNLTCILQRDTWKYLKEINQEVIQFLCSLEFYLSPHKDLEFLKTLIIKALNCESFLECLTLCLFFCNYIISSF